MRTLLLVLLPAVAIASSVRSRSWLERARDADRVVLAQVLETKTVVPDGEPRRMTTVTRVVVGEWLKGRGPDVLEVVQLGGRWGLWEAHVPGDATFQPGETALLLLRCRTAAAPGRCTLLALGEGKLQVLGDHALVRPVGGGAPERHPIAELREHLRRVEKEPAPAAGQVAR